MTTPTTHPADAMLTEEQITGYVKDGCFCAHVPADEGKCYLCRIGEMALQSLRQREDGREAVAWMNPMNGVVISAQQKVQRGEGRGYPNFSVPLYTSPPTTRPGLLEAAEICRKLAHDDRHSDAFRYGAQCCVTDIRAAADKLPGTREDKRDFEALYMDLLMQVGNKCPGESRHDTAKRYILRAEDSDDNTAKCAAGIERSRG